MEQLKLYQMVKLAAAGITKINGNFKKENVLILDQNDNQLVGGYHHLALLK